MPTFTGSYGRKKAGFGGGGGVSGSRFTGSYGRSQSKKKKRGHSLGGFLGNLAGDVKDTAVGLPVGLYETGKALGQDIAFDVAHPLGAKKGERPNHLAKVGRGVAKSYAQTYGPLTRGDVRAFAQNLYEHPVGPLLDAATVATLGGAGVAKAGELAASAGIVSKESRLANLGRAESLTLRSPRRLATGEGPTLTGRPLSRNPVVRGRQKTVDRALKQLPAKTPVVGEHARYGRELQRGPRLDVLRLQHRTDRYQRAVDRLTPEELAALHLISRGVHPDDYAGLLRRQKGNPTMLKVLKNPRVRNLVEQPTNKLRKTHAEAVKLSGELAQLKIDAGLLEPGAAAERLDLHRYLVRVFGEQWPRELPLERFYTPDVPAPVKIGDVSRAKGGVGVPRTPGSARKNEGILFSSGRLDLTHDLLGPEYRRTLRYRLYDRLHSGLVEAAVTVPRGEPLPEGWRFLRRSAGERIHAIERTSGSREQALRELVPDEHDLSTSELGRGFATSDPAEALTDPNGNRFIVPDRLADAVGGEFTRPGKVARGLLSVTNLWRIPVLGYRLGFLTNNVVGNHLLYLLHNANPSGVRAYLHALSGELGPERFRRLMRRPELRDAIGREFLQEHFPEQTETFGSTQRVGDVQRLRSRPRLRRAANAAKQGVVPATQAVAEGMLRRANVEAVLRRSPEVRAVARELSEQTPKLERLAKTALERNPELQRRVSQEVNDTLGDYLSLSPFERTYVRAAIPFYAWYRAIATISAKLVLDHPARANVLYRLGQIGQEAGLENTYGQPFPSYLQGAVPVGPAKDGTAPVLTTGGLNPFATVPQLGEAAGYLAGVGGDEGRFQALGMLNPLVAALVDERRGRAGIPGALESIGAQLPQARVLTAGPTRLYPKRSRRSELLASAGVPIKQVSLAEARRRAKREGRR